MNQSPVLSDAEVSEICAPLRTGSAQGRYLREKLGIEVRFKPNGKPLVGRKAIEHMFMDGAIPLRGLPDASAASSAPDTNGFLEHLAKRKRA